MVDGKAMLVHPATKTYVDVMDMAMASLGGLPPQLLAQLTISNVTGTMEKLGGSDMVEGRATEHYQAKIGYTMGIMGQTIPATVVSDYWIAKLPVKFTMPNAGTGKAEIPAGPMQELMKKQVELTPPMNDGVPMKTTAVTTVAVMGNSVVTTVTSEMKNVKEGDVDASKFVLPADYTKAAK
jgi:hypothetical protein